MLAMVVLLSACAGPSLRDDLIRHEPTFAKPPAQQGLLSEIAGGFTSQHGPDASGFRLLDSSYDALAARLALMDSAVSSLDVQTYLWYPDHSGKLHLERALRAAQRGVHVRLLVDDLLTIGQDQLLFELNRRPNVEVRMFNPWRDRSALARGGEFIAQMERMNTRMHDKLLIADSRAAVIGGRNIGDHYFGLSHDYNFHDLDMLGFGHVAVQANDMFDHFWNSEWVVSADNLDVEPDPEYVERGWANLQEEVRNAQELQSFVGQSHDWRAVAAALAQELHIGTSLVVFDETAGDTIAQNLARGLFGFLGLAEEELLITNAYIIPGQPGIDFIRGLTDRGVTVRILTNSLASHDVPAVNSHYRGWRDDLISAGAELYELRADPAIKPLVDVPPVEGEFVGLHTKAAVIDREYAFIGSMNFDPRSVNINTEAGAIVQSPGLAGDLARLMLRDMSPENAWQVLLDEKGKPYWVNSDETVYRQPARSGSQRIMNKIFKVVPKEQY
jgi:putative cardiolipin synthase